MTPSAGDASRGPLAGVAMILRYNWPLYLAGVAAGAIGATVAAERRLGPRVRAGGAAAALGAGWLATSSLVASWWVYDRSELYRWTWLARWVPGPPERVLVLHAGLDEASAGVERMWPAADVEPVDVHGGTGRTTASLRRARGTASARPTSDTWLVPDVDAAVAFLAVHELRSAHARTNLLAAVRGRLRPGGRLVIVEHVRDLANGLAFGPAIGHFYPVGEWRRVIAGAGLTLVGEERITPFVVLLAAERRA